MVKYYNAMVVFEEIPNEITLAINITNCPCRCKDCHSKILWEDIGIELTFNELKKIIEKDNGITCICFMGGDNDTEYINSLASFVRNNFHYLKVAWYSGRDKLSDNIILKNFDFIKIGHFDKNFGSLNKRTTNQRLYKIDNNKLIDITSLFWKTNEKYN